MDKELIKQLLEDGETRLEIASGFGLKMEDCDHPKKISWDYDDIMVETLSKLNDTLAVGDMITIEISDHVWVRGEYVRTAASGDVVVEVPSEIKALHSGYYQGKRVDLVIKAKEGEADV